MSKLKTPPGAKTGAMVGGVTGWNPVPETLMELMVPFAAPLFFTCKMTVLLVGVVPAVATFTPMKVMVWPGATGVGVVPVPVR
jgi:hypothetical protein